MLLLRYGFGEKKELKKLKSLLIIYFCYLALKKNILMKKILRIAFVGHPLIEKER